MRHTSPTSKNQVRNNQVQKSSTQEGDRASRRVVGKIVSVSKMQAIIRVKDRHGSHIYGGNNGTPVLIIDDPIDILQRFGEIRPGMRVEVFYSGMTESRQAQARIIGPPVEDAEGLKPESTEIDSAPVLPFEPMGF